MSKKFVVSSTFTSGTVTVDGLDYTVGTDAFATLADAKAAAVAQTVDVVIENEDDAEKASFKFAASDTTLVAQSGEYTTEVIDGVTYYVYGGNYYRNYSATISGAITAAAGAALKLVVGGSAVYGASNGGTASVDNTALVINSTTNSNVVSLFVDASAKVFVGVAAAINTLDISVLSGSGTIYAAGVVGIGDAADMPAAFTGKMSVNPSGTSASAIISDVTGVTSANQFNFNGATVYAAGKANTVYGDSTADKVLSDGEAISINIMGSGFLSGMAKDSDSRTMFYSGSYAGTDDQSGAITGTAGETAMNVTVSGFEANQFFAGSANGNLTGDIVLDIDGLDTRRLYMNYYSLDGTAANMVSFNSGISGTIKNSDITTGNSKGYLSFGPWAQASTAFAAELVQTGDVNVSLSNVNVDGNIYAGGYYNLDTVSTASGYAVTLDGDVTLNIADSDIRSIRGGGGNALTRLTGALTVNVTDVSGSTTIDNIYAVAGSQSSVGSADFHFNSGSIANVVGIGGTGSSLGAFTVEVAGATVGSVNLGAADSAAAADSSIASAAFTMSSGSVTGGLTGDTYGVVTGTVSANLTGGSVSGSISGFDTLTLSGTSAITGGYAAGLNGSRQSSHVTLAGNASIASSFFAGAGAVFSNQTADISVTTQSTEMTIEGGVASSSLYLGGASIQATGTDIDTSSDVTGTATLNMTAGQLKKSLYGGGLAQTGAGAGDTNHTVVSASVANSVMNISGGSVGRSVFAGGQIAMTGAATLSATATVSVDTSSVTISGGTIGSAEHNVNVYGGGLIDSENLVNTLIYAHSTVGTSAITISGGTITGSVYAGGFNTVDPTSFNPDIVNTVETSTITISGGTITGGVYGTGGNGATVGTASLVFANEGAYTLSASSVSGFDNVAFNGGTVTFSNAADLSSANISVTATLTGSAYTIASGSLDLTGATYTVNGHSLALGDGFASGGTGYVLGYADNALSLQTVSVNSETTTLYFNSAWTGKTAGDLVVIDGAYYEIGVNAFASMDGAYTAVTGAANSLVLSSDVVFAGTNADWNNAYALLFANDSTISSDTAGVKRTISTPAVPTDDLMITSDDRSSSLSPTTPVNITISQDIAIESTASVWLGYFQAKEAYPTYLGNYPVNITLNGSIHVSGTKQAHLFGRGTSMTIGTTGSLTVDGSDLQTRGTDLVVLGTGKDMAEAQVQLNHENIEADVADSFSGIDFPAVSASWMLSNTFVNVNTTFGLNTASNNRGALAENAKLTMDSSKLAVGTNFTMADWSDVELMNGSTLTVGGNFLLGNDSTIVQGASVSLVGGSELLIGGTLNVQAGTVLTLDATSVLTVGSLTNSGSITAEAGATITIASAYTANTGASFTIDAGAASESLYKVVSGYAGIDYSSITVTGSDAYHILTNGNNLYLSNIATSTVYVNSAWTGKNYGDAVTLADGTTAYFGINAFLKNKDAYAAMDADGTLVVDGGTVSDAITAVGGKNIGTLKINSGAAFTCTDYNIIGIGTAQLTVGAWVIDGTANIGGSASAGCTFGTASFSGTGLLNLRNPSSANGFGFSINGDTTGFTGTLQTTRPVTLVGTSAAFANAASIVLIGASGADGGNQSGNLTLSGITGVTYDGKISGDGKVSLTGSSSVSIQENGNTFTGAYSVASGSVLDLDFSRSALTVSDGGVLMANNTSAWTLSNTGATVYLMGNRNVTVSANTGTIVTEAKGAALNAYSYTLDAAMTGTWIVGTTSGTVSGDTVLNVNNSFTTVQVGSGNSITGDITVTAGANASGTNLYASYNDSITGDVTLNLNQTGTIKVAYGIQSKGGTGVKLDGDLTVNMTSGTVSSLYGINYHGSTDSHAYGVTGDINITLSGGSVTEIRGGNSTARTETTQEGILAEMATYTAENVNITVNGTGEADKIYGASLLSVTGKTTINVADSAVVTTIYAGSKYTSAASTEVNISGGTVGKVYAGGAGGSSSIAYSTVGNAAINISGGTVGNVYAGGGAGDTVTASVITISGGSITGLVSGSGDSGATVGAATITVSGGTFGTDASVSGFGTFNWNHSSVVFGNNITMTDGADVFNVNSGLSLNGVLSFGEGSGDTLNIASGATFTYGAATISGLDAITGSGKIILTGVTDMTGAEWAEANNITVEGVTITTAKIEADEKEIEPAVSSSVVLDDTNTENGKSSVVVGDVTGITVEADAKSDVGEVRGNVVSDGTASIDNGKAESTLVIDGSVSGQNVNIGDSTTANAGSVEISGSVSADETVLINNAGSVEIDGTVSGGSVNIVTDTPASDNGTTVIVGGIESAGDVTVTNGDEHSITGGTVEGVEKPVEINAGGDVTIENDGHLNVDITTGGAVVISRNTSMNTLTGTIDGGSVEYTGTGSATNLTVTAANDITLTNNTEAGQAGVVSTSSFSSTSGNIAFTNAAGASVTDTSFTVSAGNEITFANAGTVSGGTFAGGTVSLSGAGTFSNITANADMLYLGGATVTLNAGTVGEVNLGDSLFDTVSGGKLILDGTSSVTGKVSGARFLENTPAYGELEIKNGGEIAFSIENVETVTIDGAATSFAAAQDYTLNTLAVADGASLAWSTAPATFSSIDSGRVAVTGTTNAAMTFSADYGMDELDVTGFSGAVTVGNSAGLTLDAAEEFFNDAATASVGSGSSVTLALAGKTTGIAFSGAGTLNIQENTVLTDANSIAAIVVSEGKTLELQNDFTGSSITLGTDDPASVTTLSLNASGLSISGTISGDSDDAITAGNSVTLASANALNAFSGTVGIGANTLTLSGANTTSATFTGTGTIDANAALSLSGTGALNGFSGTVDLDANTLTLSGVNSTSATLTGSGTIAANADQTLSGDLSGFTGGYTVSSGNTLTTTSSATLAAEMTVGGSGSYDLSGTVSGGAALTLNSSETVAANAPALTLGVADAVLASGTFGATSFSGNTLTITGASVGNLTGSAVGELDLTGLTGTLSGTLSVFDSVSFAADKSITIAGAVTDIGEYVFDLGSTVTGAASTPLLTANAGVFTGSTFTVNANSDAFENKKFYELVSSTNAAQIASLTLNVAGVASPMTLAVDGLAERAVIGGTTYLFQALNQSGTVGIVMTEMSLPTTVLVNGSWSNVSGTAVEWPVGSGTMYQIGYNAAKTISGAVAALTDANGSATLDVVAAGTYTTGAVKLMTSANGVSDLLVSGVNAGDVKFSGAFYGSDGSFAATCLVLENISVAGSVYGGAANALVSSTLVMDNAYADKVSVSVFAGSWISNGSTQTETTADTSAFIRGGAYAGAYVSGGQYVTSGTVSAGDVKLVYENSAANYLLVNGRTVGGVASGAASSLTLASSSVIVDTSSAAAGITYLAGDIYAGGAEISSGSISVTGDSTVLFSGLGSKLKFTGRVSAGVYNGDGTEVAGSEQVVFADFVNDGTSKFQGLIVNPDTIVFAGDTAVTIGRKQTLASTSDVVFQVTGDTTTARTMVNVSDYGWQFGTSISVAPVSGFAGTYTLASGADFSSGYTFSVAGTTATLGSEVVVNGTSYTLAAADNKLTLAVTGANVTGAQTGTLTLAAASTFGAVTVADALTLSVYTGADSVSASGGSIALADNATLTVGRGVNLATNLSSGAGSEKLNMDLASALSGTAAVDVFNLNDADLANLVGSTGATSLADGLAATNFQIDGNDVTLGSAVQVLGSGTTDTSDDLWMCLDKNADDVLIASWGGTETEAGAAITAFESASGVNFGGAIAAESGTDDYAKFNLEYFAQKKAAGALA